MPVKQKSGPDFLGIGPTKTGTSWLYMVLREHPEIWLPPVSEVNYYWGTGKRKPRKTLYKRIRQSILGDLRIPWRKYYFHQRMQEYRNAARIPDLKALFWDLKYLCFPQSATWYRSLFPNTKTRGDITGGYYVMDDKAIASIAQHLPDVKIIMTFRDPVERLWSDARMWCLRLAGKTFDEVPERAFYQRIEKEHARLPSYVTLYDRWAAHFDASQIMVNYYDDLVSDPAVFVRGICAFLNVTQEVTGGMDPYMHQRIFEGPKVSMPEQMRAYLIHLCTPMVRELSSRTQHPYPQHWLESYMEHAARQT